MLTLIPATSVKQGSKQASVQSRNRLDYLREQYGISWQKLNEIAKGVIDRPFKDVSELSEMENKKVRDFFTKNRMQLVGKSPLSKVVNMSFVSRVPMKVEVEQDIVIECGDSTRKETKDGFVFRRISRLGKVDK